MSLTHNILTPCVRAFTWKVRDQIFLPIIFSNPFSTPEINIYHVFFVVLTLLFCASRPPMNCLFHSKTLGLLFRIFTKTHRANVSLTRLIIFGYFFRKIHSFSASSITGKHVTASTTPPQATHLVSRTLEKDQSSPGINI